MKSQHIKHIQIKERLLRYAVLPGRDDAPVLVFLHDALGSIEQWKSFPEKICNRTGCQGIVIDRYGHGGSSVDKSAPLPTDFLEREAEDLHEILHHLDIQNPILIGSSDGGSIALIYGVVHSAKAIISMAGHYFNEDATRDGVQAMKKDSIKEKIISGLEKYHGDRAAKLVEAWQEVWTSDRFRDWSIASSLDKISCPVLVLQGYDDNYATDYHAISLCEKIGANADCHLIEGGHFPHLDNEEKAIEITAKFLQKLL